MTLIYGYRFCRWIAKKIKKWVSSEEQVALPPLPNPFDNATAAVRKVGLSMEKLSCAMGPLQIFHAATVDRMARIIDAEILQHLPQTEVETYQQMAPQLMEDIEKLKEQKEKVEVTEPPVRVIRILKKEHE
jgi:hypothetical protein